MTAEALVARKQQDRCEAGTLHRVVGRGLRGAQGWSAVRR